MCVSFLQLKSVTKIIYWPRLLARGMQNTVTGICVDNNNIVFFGFVSILSFILYSLVLGSQPMGLIFLKTNNFEY
jgi:hypothetical protein